MLSLNFFHTMNLDFDKCKIAILYDKICTFPYILLKIKFQKKVVKRKLFKTDSFKNLFPLVIIDCSRQNESVKSGTMDVRLEFEFKKNIPVNTTAYCLIIHDCVIEYSLLSNTVRKIS